jgi:hypothetical protein
LPVFCISVKPGLLHWERVIGWGCSRFGCWGRYLGLRGRRYRGVEKTTKRGALAAILLTKHDSGDQIKEDAMGGMYG